ncbi:hypothetical protein [Ornithobacterium rhinotracheale]|uniref:hypothetical protein n=1 Tax=Ornithobacterium rhinotracheale TaxID=28251 RepID=UPI001FF4D1ED|nr:hypothetical protein [Ornithobacterium rhinotracheale]MCK0206282.1 hypothetical protein [Ornithobacterium rhinotracheale]
MRKLIIKVIFCSAAIVGSIPYTYAQQTVINHVVKVSTPMPDLLQSLAEKSGKKIDFKASDLDDILVSPHDFKNLTLKEALEYLSSNYPIEVDYEKGKIEILRDYSRDQLLGLNNKIDLKSVVVTALGIKREEKSLGYALQEIKGDDLVASKEKILQML